MKLELDPDIHPAFETYTRSFNTENGVTEVWACCTSESAAFGIEQDQEVIVFTREELLKLQALINHAVEILGN